MIRLSIIVPAVNEQTAIDATLLSVLENRPSNCEVIVACRESYEDPYDLGDEVRFVRCPDESPVGILLNRGISNSFSNRIHWITPGTIATEGWTESPLRTLASEKARFVSPLILDDTDAERIAIAGICYGRGGTRKTVGRRVRFPSRKALRLRAESPSIHAGFCDAETLAEMGGFRASFGEQLTDADLAARISASGESCQVDTSSVVVLHARDSQELTETGFRRGRQLERFYWEHIRKNGLSSILSHMGHVVVDTLKQLSQGSAIMGLIGRFVGAIDSIRGLSDGGDGISLARDEETATRRAA